MKIPTQIFAVSPSDLGDAWGHAETYLQKACNASSGEITLESVAQSVESGKSQLWVIFRTDTNECLAAGITKLVIYPSGKKSCCIDLLGGKHRKSWLHLLRKIEDYARTEDCEEVVMYARKGWSKELREYSMTHHVLRLAV